MSFKVSKPILFATIFLFFVSICYSQTNNNDGYWDKENIITQTFSLNGQTQFLNSDANKKIIKIDLPVGTTKIFYKITVIQEKSKSFVSLKNTLTALSFISNEAKIANSLLDINSNGTNKCYYSVFSSIDEAKKYKEYGIKGSNPCYTNSNQISSHTNVLYENSLCLNNSNFKNTIYFGIKNTNSFESENIYLEVMPWINNKQATGWNTDIKKDFLYKCKKRYTTTPNDEDFCLCILDKLIEDYSVDEYNRLLPIERQKHIESKEIDCKESTGINEQITEQIQDEADNYFDIGDYKNAIEKYLELVENKKADVNDYQGLAESYLLTKQFTKALKYIKIAEQLDSDDLSIKLDLAHSLLLTDNFEEAKKIYLKYKNENIDDKISWIKNIKDDFKEMIENGFNSDYFNIILNVIK